MRRFRFSVVLFLLIMLIVSMSSCAQKPSENADWVWVGSSINKMGALTEDGYYYFNTPGSVLSYADLTGKGQIALCSKVGCEHDDEYCDAYVFGLPKNLLFFHNNHIYYVDRGQFGVLYRRDATGSKLMEIGTPGKQYVEKEKYCEINAYVQAGDYLYYSAEIQGSEINEDATVVYTDAYCVGRIHLSSGKDEILAEQSADKTGAQLMLFAARAGGALFGVYEGVDLPAGDPGFVEAYGKSAVSLKCWSEDTGEITELVGKPKSEFNEIQLVEDGKVYYSTQYDTETGDRCDNYTYDLDTGKTKLVCENATLVHYGNGFALRKTNEDKKYQVYNLKNGKVFPMEISNVPLLYANSDSGIVVGKYEYDEEVPTKVKGVAYCYVPYTTLEDGMQEADLVLLYTMPMGAFNDK